MHMAFTATAALICFATGAAATELPATTTVFDILLLANDQSELDVGDLEVMPESDGNYTYVVNWDDSQFSDQFLSMRPFKCLDGPKKQWCRVPYPYENKHRVAEGDFTDLEYDLLFIWKNRNDYGIDMWNGVYYVLEMAHDGLGGLMHEMDMDILSAPPDDGNLRPIGESDLEPAELEGHWLPMLKLRPRS